MPRGKIATTVPPDAKAVGSSVMGAKTAILAFCDGDLRPILRNAVRSDDGAAEAFVRRVHPGYDVELDAESDGEYDGEDTLLEGTYPPDDVASVTILPGAEIVCDRRVIFDLPSELPERWRTLGAGRRIIMHGMHSAVDWMCFAVWDDGTLVRSLSLTPEGILENIGEPFDFERTFWTGDHEDVEPLPFHPLDLGEEALRAFFGFTIEGSVNGDDIDAEEVHLHRFRVTDPTGAEQAEREAQYELARQMMESPDF